MNHPGTGLLPVDEKSLITRLTRLTLEQKVTLLTGADAWHVPGCAEIGLSPMLLSDGPNGVRGERFNDERDPGLLLPNLAALAATWDPQLLFRAGELLGEEARRKRVHVLLGPTVNMQRTLTGGRNFENFSEDPLLTARLARSYVEGVQSRGVAACPKHFVANDSETERFGYDVRVGERALREIYLAPFEETTVGAGAATVMAAYNAVRGQTMTENAPLVEGVLKTEWGFDGVVLSDWMAARSTEGTALGGLDLAMPGPAGPWGAALVTAVREGRVPEETVDGKVLRLLRLAARVGALDCPPAPATDRVPAPPAEAAAHIRELTARTFVLLRNDGLLPLRPRTLRTVALVGPAAVAPAHQGGGSASLTAARLTEPRHALRAALPADVELTVHRGVRSRINLDPLAVSRTRNPETGGPGAVLEYLDADGEVVLTEDRQSFSLSWIGFPGVPALPPGAAAMRLRTTLAAPRRGTHTFSAAGTGRLLLHVGGKEVLRADGAPREGVEDVMRRTPDHRVTVGLDGTDTDVTLTLDAALVASPVQFIELTLGHDDSPLTEEEEFAAAVEAAGRADAVVLMLGTSDDVESESFDRPDVRLPGRQDELAAAVLRANPDTVVVVNASSPVVMDWAERAPSLLWTFFGGQEYGGALADVLLGVAEPTGRLTATFPRAAADAPVPDAIPVDGVLDYDEGLLIGHRSYEARGTEPLFAFGHGTGYTRWTYESAALSPDARGTLARGHDTSVRVRLRNTGDRAGREIVQVYAAGAEGDLAAPPRQLVGFAVAQAGPGDTADVDVRLTPRALSRYTDGGWELPDGPRRLWLGHSSADLALTVDL